ncbi:MAG: peptidylprolyl isomerase [Desulfurococcales archaeon]|nr:peptidylprolyl isomerase [Desulfurococcales archaeon]
MPLKDGDVVLVHFTIKAVEGDKEVIVDTTKKELAEKEGIYDPNKQYREAVIVIGKSKLLDAVEEVIRELDVGTKKEIIAPPEKAYGPRNEQLIIKVPVKTLRRQGIRPVVGEELEVQGRRGKIIRVTERFAYIDFNHPLAGKTLKIELEITRKLETDEEKIKYLATRWFGVDEEKVNVEVEDKKARVTLPPEIVVLKDLDSLLQMFLNDIYETTELDEVTVAINFKFRRAREEEKSEETEEAKSEAEEEASEESSTESEEEEKSKE